MLHDRAKRKHAEDVSSLASVHWLLSRTILSWLGACSVVSLELSSLPGSLLLSHFQIVHVYKDKIGPGRT